MNRPILAFETIGAAVQGVETSERADGLLDIHLAEHPAAAPTS